MKKRRCPAWADGEHCFAMDAGALGGVVIYDKRDKRCACGAIVPRRMQLPPSKPSPVADHSRTMEPKR